MNLNQFINRFGLLIYIASFVAVIFGIAVFGASDGIAWLLIGPIMFFFVLKTVTPGSAVEWRHPTAVSLTGNSASEPQFAVSLVFHRINVMISSITRELIKLLTSGESQALMANAMSRERIMSELLTLQIPNGGFRTLAAETLLQCSREMDAARTVALGERDLLFQNTKEYKDSSLAAASYRTTSPEHAKHLSNDQSRTYVKELLYRVWSGTAVDQGPTVLRHCADEATAFVNDHGGSIRLDEAVADPMSCAQLWCWMGLGVYTEVSEAEDDIQQRYGFDNATFRKIKEDIVEKLTTPKIRFNAYGEKIGDRDPVQPDPSLIPVIIGGYILGEMMQHSNLHGTALSSIAENTGIQVPARNFSETMDENQVQRVGLIHAQHIVAVENQNEIITYSHALPYFQGLMLYFLGLSFPFFAALLLIPGRAGGFLAWIGLWTWAKSWDVGWALVLLLEQFLWNMLPHSGLYSPLQDPNHGPISIFESAFREDGGYYLSTYYVIIGTLLAGVPVLTGQLLLGAHSSMLMPMLGNLKRFAGSLSGGLGNWVKVEQLAEYDQLRESFVGRYVSERSGDIMDRSNHANPFVSDIADNHIKPIEDLADRLEQGGAMDQEIALGDVYRALNLTGAATNSKIARQRAVNALRRSANSAKADLIRANGAYLYHQAGNTDEYKTLDALRGGISRRVHPWDKQDSPWGTTRDFDQNMVARDAHVQGIQSRLRAELTSGLYKGS